MAFEWILTAASGVYEWGPRALDFVEHRASPYTSEEFVEQYSECVRDAIDLVPDVLNFGAAQLQAGTEGVLSQMASVVRAYHGHQGVEVNANYMVPARPTQPLLDEAKFCRKERRPDSFGCFLVLQQWAKPVDALPGRLVLPVEHEDGGDAMLFGAPKAYATNRPQIIDDVDRWDLFSDHESQKVRTDLKEYFDHHSEHFKSFVSIPVVPPKDHRFAPLAGCSPNVMGVVNIQCSRKHVLGRVAANQRKLLMVLLPLVHVLSYYLLRMNALSGERPAA